jgi:hypothetical protein
VRFNVALTLGYILSDSVNIVFFPARRTVSVERDVREVAGGDAPGGAALAAAAVASPARETQTVVTEAAGGGRGLVKTVTTTTTTRTTVPVSESVVDWPTMLAEWVHHAFSLAGLFAALFTRFNLLYTAMCLVNEASTPFLNFHFIFEEAWRGSWKRSANGFFMWASYTVCRIAVLLFISASIACTVASSARLQEPQFRAQIALAVALLALACLLNAFWYYKITIGLARSVCGGGGGAKGAKGATPKGAKTTTTTVTMVTQTTIVEAADDGAGGAANAGGAKNKKVQ